MKSVHVVVKPNSMKGPLVLEELDGSLLVYVREPAQDGKANKAVIRELAKYYGVSKTSIKLQRGISSKFKTYSIVGY